jgi:hypothetical protein
MRVCLSLLSLLAVGCRSYIEIYDLAAERGQGEEVLVRFKAKRDVTRAAQFYGANLGVPSQVDPNRDGADDALYYGHSRADAPKVVRESEEPGPVYAFRASFPLRGEFRGDPRISHPYDLSVPGTHELEFWAGGGNCGGPGGFYTNRVRFTYRVP